MTTERNRVFSVLVCLLATIPVSIWATASRADTAVEKAGRGLAAMTTPFLEIPGNIVDTTEHDGALSGWTMGLARGIGMTAVRPVVGVYELVTAPVAVPKNYEPILQPEYPWSYFGVGEKFARNSKHSRIAKK